LLRWFAARGWHDQQISEHAVILLGRIVDIAPDLIERHHRKACKRSKKFEELTAAQRHRLRIALKNLHYTIEFLGSLFDKDRVRTFVKCLTSLRDDLGYVSRRTRDWLKCKCKQEQEFIVGGYTDPRGSRSGFGALLLGYYRGRKLVYAGKVGTGFDQDLLRRLGEKLARLETPVSPFAEDGLPRRGVHWVKPKLIAQIGFTEWTGEGKLRHPRFLGLRNDKRPEDIVREG
jgi:hypothetical protein